MPRPHKIGREYREVLDEVARAGVHDLFGPDWSDAQVHTFVEEWLGKSLAADSLIMIAARMCYDRAVARGSATEAYNYTMKTMHWR